MTKNMTPFTVPAGSVQTLKPENSSGITSIKLEENATLILQGVQMNVTNILLTKNATLILQGAQVSVSSSITTAAGVRIYGNGKIIITGLIDIGPNCVIDLSEIAVMIYARMIVAEHSSIILRDYPIIGTGNSTALRFEGMFSENPTIKFSAPCRQVFKNITVEGQVLTEEAYPEWFVGDEETDKTDWAVAINKAFDMTQNGIVRLQSRLYKVASTIYVPVRGQLLGTGSGWWQTDKVSSHIEDLAGTVILIDNVSNKDAFDAGCVVLVNYDQTKVYDLITDNANSTVENKLDAVSLYKILKDEVYSKSLYQKEWVNPGGKIANIYFANRDYGDSSQVLDEHPLNLCCILVSGCMAFDQLTFRQFRNAIVWANKYADQKEVTRCYFMHDRYQSEEDDPNKEHYLLDFGNVGDALVCRGNGFNSESSTGARFLRIHQCFGGSIADNIINGDVDISGCKGLDFTGNHLENGAQVTITSSVINLSNNYFEKGVRPNIIIKSDDEMNAPVINLTNNSFVYIPANRPILVNGSWEYDQIANICDYDIIFKGVAKWDQKYYLHGPLATVNISNSMRYSGKSVRNNYPMGIKIGKSYELKGNGDPSTPYQEDITELDNFNHRSQIYSTRSTLLVCHDDVTISSDCVTLKKLEKATIYGIGKTTNIPWFLPLIQDMMVTKNTYQYFYQFIWDYDKKYVSPSGEKDLDGSDEFNITSKNEGVSLSLGSMSDFGSAAMLRVIRVHCVFKRNPFTGEATEMYTTEYADVPLITCRIVYDCGVSVNGYKWQRTSSVDAVTIKGTEPSEITYMGEKCILDKKADDTTGR